MIRALARLLAVSVIAFFLYDLAPGDIHSGDQLNPQTSAQTLDAWRRREGLDQPAPTRYARWLAGIAHGDLGRSLAYGTPVTGLIADRAPHTAAILLPAWTLSWLIGLALAFLAAARRRVETWTPPATALSLLPGILTASLLFFAALKLNLSVTQSWLPVTALTLGLLPVVFLHAARGLDEARRQPFVRLAESRQIPAKTLWLRYILPAAAHPLLSLAGLSLSAALSATLVMEPITGWPGLGALFFDAVQARDYPIVQAVVVAMAALLTLSNLAAHAALLRVDPRLRGGADAPRH